MCNDTRNRLEQLRNRCAALKADPSKRHTPNSHDLAKCAENTALIYQYQVSTIKEEVQHG